MSLEGYAITVTLVTEIVRKTQLMARERQLVQKEMTSARWSKMEDMSVSRGSFETVLMSATKNT